MKREVEALDRAYRNVRTAREEMFRHQDQAFEKMMDAFVEFSEGHHGLFRNLDDKVSSALADLQRDINTPPPLPRNSVFDEFSEDLKAMEQRAGALQ